MKFPRTAFIRGLVRDTWIEKSVRLVLTAIAITIGMYFLTKGYHRAFSGDEAFFLPDEGENAEPHFYDLLGFLSFAIAFIGNRIRVFSWAIILFVAWWAYQNIVLYLADGYYIMGQDGCLPCENQMAKFYLGVTGLSFLAAISVIVAMFRTENVPTWRLSSGLGLMLVWLYLGIAVA
jgi:hypothetical protein